MRFILIILLTCVFVSCKERSENMNYSDIGTQHPIIGSLGKPLGTIVQIEGQIQTGQSKTDMDKVLCEVHKIDRKQLAESIIIPVKVFEWVSGEIPEPGESVKCLGYETGGMTGIPREAFSHVPYVTTTDYSFTVSFQVIKWVE